jgi:hypothetical protein
MAERKLECGRPAPQPYCTCLECEQARIAQGAASLGRKGGAAGTGASKRRDVDYAALGRKGGAAGKGKRKRRDEFADALRHAAAHACECGHESVIHCGKDGACVVCANRVVPCASYRKRKRTKKKETLMKMLFLALMLSTAAVADDSLPIPPTTDGPPAWVVVVTYRDADRVVQTYERTSVTPADAQRWAGRVARRGFCREWAYGSGGAEIACYPANRVIEVVARQR